MNKFKSKYNLTSTVQNLNPSFFYLFLGKIQCKDVSMVTKTHSFCFSVPTKDMRAFRFF